MAKKSAPAPVEEAVPSPQPVSGSDDFVVVDHEPTPAPTEEVAPARAFATVGDAEVDRAVAAHLGEVLWANGKQREARQIWEKFLKEQPESPILRGTIKRLTGSETL